MVSAYSLWRTGSLWWAIGVHATWDWGQSFLYGVSDSGVTCEGRLLTAHPAGDPLFSGGVTGPEGSLFAIGILLIAAVLIRCTLPKRKYAELWSGAAREPVPSANPA
jgi:CAAX protease family protein